MLKIIHLFERPDSISLVSSWIYHEFWADKDGYSISFFEKLLMNADSLDSIPYSRLALWNDEPVGTINLIEDDDEERPHLTPWLAALFVKPELRKKSIGTELISACKQDAKALGFKELYLGTDNPDYYQKRGAHLYEKTRTDIVIMKIDL